MSIRFPTVSPNILDAVGDTPLLNIEGVYVKIEFLNPSGSIKVRIAKYMIERAEREGLLKPGDTIVEATSGNTGNALSLVAAVKGYRMLVVMPEGLSSERVTISRAHGAEVCSAVTSTSTRRWSGPGSWAGNPAISHQLNSSLNGMWRKTA